MASGRPIVNITTSEDAELAEAPTVEELAAWLIDHGLAEERSGYGHASGEKVAEALLDAFYLYRKGAGDE